MFNLYRMISQPASLKLQRNAESEDGGDEWMGRWAVEQKDDWINSYLVFSFIGITWVQLHWQSVNRGSD